MIREASQTFPSAAGFLKPMDISIMAQVQRASVLTVDFGFTKVQGLILPDGSYVIAIPQIAEHFQFDKGQASRNIANMMGANFKFIKCACELHPKPVNVIKATDFPRLVFELAKRGNSKAIETWNAMNPDKPFAEPKSPLQPRESIEAQVEDFLMESYVDLNPHRQVVTDSGVADVVHDYGVVEIKEYKSIRSAHLALGQAVAYGGALNKQPEVLLFNVPDAEAHRIITMFTRINILIWIFSEADIKRALRTRVWRPSRSNSIDMQAKIPARRDLL